MNITLKQNELEAAVRQYVGQQGISFNGRSLTSIRFSATRNPAGFIAEIVLEDKSLETTDTVIPGFTDRPAGTDTGLALVGTVNSAADVTTVAGTAQAPAAGTIGAAIANVVSTTAAADQVQTGANTDDVAKTVPEEAAQAAEAPVDTAVATETAAAPAAATTTSLFGG
jgi:hypothetical protein